MAEKLRRRVRARILHALTRSAGAVPHTALRAVLGAASEMARFTRFETLTRANLELALGATTDIRERDRIATGVRKHSARLLAEWVRLARSGGIGTPQAHRGAWIDDAVTLDASVARLEREIERGRGALVVTAHIGNWELLAARLARMGYGGAVIGYERPNDSSAAWLTDMRRAYGVTTLNQNSDPREILRVLRRGEVIGLLCDLEVRRLDGEFLPFFGIPALTMTAPAALARAHGIPLLPAACVLTGANYRLHFEEPLEFDATLPRREARDALLARLNETFETWIRAHPEQWAWHQPRWRTRPGAHRSVPLAERVRETRALRRAAGTPSGIATVEQRSDAPGE